jgi:hypothetical protein
MTYGKRAMTAELARDILAAKQLARRHQARRAWTLLWGGVAGVSLASVVIVAGFLQEWTPYLLVGGLAAGLGFAALMLALGRNVLFATGARCPECDHDWELHRPPPGRPHDVMSNWAACPGCGVEMRSRVLEEFLQREALQGGWLHTRQFDLPTQSAELGAEPGADPDLDTQRDVLEAPRAEPRVERAALQPAFRSERA